jgi:outer membrane protein OmpA-like peptidoglycan-associated protein
MTALNSIKLIYVVTLLVAGTTTIANAQLYLGGSGQSNVVVDYSVIDNLGRSPTVPQLLLGIPGTAAVPGGTHAAPMPKFPVFSSGQSSTKSGRIKLRPPKVMQKRTTKKKRTVRKPERKFTRTARPVPAVKRAPQQIRPIAPPTALTRPKLISAPPLPKISMPTRTTKKKRTVRKPERKFTRTARPVPAVKRAPQQIRPIAPPTALTRLKLISAPPLPKISMPTRTPKSHVASLPSIGQPLKASTSTRIGFSAGSAKLNSDASARLQDVSASLKKNGALRIQLLSYAGAKDGSASQARRLSLSRALAARSYLIEKGIRSTSIDVRALGNQSGNGPTDRIDILVTTR